MLAQHQRKRNIIFSTVDASVSFDDDMSADVIHTYTERGRWNVGMIGLGAAARGGAKKGCAPFCQANGFDAEFGALFTMDEGRVLGTQYPTAPYAISSSFSPDPQVYGLKYQ